MPKVTVRKKRAQSLWQHHRIVLKIKIIIIIIIKRKKKTLRKTKAVPDCNREQLIIITRHVCSFENETQSCSHILF